MATRFPGALDRDPDELPDNIADSDNLNSPNHATVHNNVNGAVLQIEEKLGTGDTTPATGAVLIGTGTGTSAWDTTPTFVGDVTIPEGDLILGSTAVSSSAAELNLLDGSTAGTVVASKAVVVDANKDISSFRNVTLTGELDAATLDLSSSADIAGDLVLSGGADGALQFTNAGENSIKIPDNQASALIIEEADNAYITFATTNSSEAITVAKTTNFSGDIDVDGTTNLDAVDIDGAVQIDSTVTVGVDDTGYDVKFFGATTGSYMLWDEDQNDLMLYGASQLNLDNLTASSGTEWVSLPESYGMYTDNTGPGSASSRMWINGINGAALYIGPRSGSHTWNLIRLAASSISLLGTVSKTAGSFDIAHPSKGGDWRLRHSFIEGPTADNIYRGTITISGDSATIDLDTVSGMTDGTWVALNTNPWSMVSSSGNAVTWSLSGKTLTINGPDGAVCNWMVIGERKDQGIVDSPMTDSNGKLVVEYEDAERDACPEE